MKDEKEDGKTKYGLLAQQIYSAMRKLGIDPTDQDLIEVVENLEGRDDGMYCRNGTHYRVNYENLHALHIAAIQDIEKRVSKLEQEVK